MSGSLKRAFNVDNEQNDCDSSEVSDATKLQFMLAMERSDIKSIVHGWLNRVVCEALNRDASVCRFVWPSRAQLSESQQYELESRNCLVHLGIYKDRKYRNVMWIDNSWLFTHLGHELIEFVCVLGRAEQEHTELTLPPNVTELDSMYERFACLAVIAECFLDKRYAELDRELAKVRDELAKLLRIRAILDSD